MISYGASGETRKASKQAVYSQVVGNFWEDLFYF